MEANKILFRPSGLGEVMSGVGKKWDVENSLTCKRYLIKMFRQIKYGRYYSFSNKYTQKGIKMENDAITLYSLLKNKYFEKNTVRFENDFFSGEFDIFDKKELTTIDIKCSFGLDTFPHKITDAPDSGYIDQGLAYNDLTGATKHIIAYCLVNAPANLIDAAKRSKLYELGLPVENESSPDWIQYLDECCDIEKNMIFDIAQFKKDNPEYQHQIIDWQFDIPKEERVVEFTIERNEDRTEAIKQRIIECRKWMEKLK